MPTLQVQSSGDEYDDEDDDIVLEGEYQEDYNSSTELSALPKSNSTSSKRSHSRSSSPSQQRSIANHGRSKSKKKRSSSTRRPNSDVLCDTSNSTMAKSKDTKIRELQAKHKAMLKNLEAQGLTLDENSKLVKLRCGDSEDDCGDDGSDNGCSGSEDNGQTTKKVAARPSKSSKPAARPSKAVANMQAQLAVTTHKEAKKKKKAPEDETHILIRDCVRNNLWALIKFVTSTKTQEKAAAKCLEFLNLDGFNGKGKECDAQRAQWIKAYGPVVTAAINNQRSYTQNRCKNSAIRWMADHEGALPSEALLKKCLERKIDLNNAEEVEVMKWFWDDLMNMAAGNMDDWKTDHRHYLPLSTGSPPHDDSMPYITASTEAIAVTFIQNNRSKWPALYAAKLAHPRASKVLTKPKIEVDANGDPTEEFTWQNDIENGVLLCNGAKYMTKFTETAAGQQDFNGWSKAGREYNVAMKKLNEAARKAKGTENFEKAILAMIKADHGKTAASAEEERKNKRPKTNKNKAPVEEDEDDGMEF